MNMHALAAPAVSRGVGVTRSIPQRSPGKVSALIGEAGLSMPDFPLNLRAFVGRHRISPEGFEYLRDAIQLGPSRAVGDYAIRNVCSEFQSRKMGCSISTESRTGELSWAVHMEMDDRCIAYLSQPPEVSVPYSPSEGSMRRRIYTPDFVAFRDDGAVVYEVKTRKDLERLVAKRPSEWTSSDDGFRYDAADRLFSGWGMRFEVICTASLSKIRAANYRLLMKIDPADACASPDLQKVVRKALDRRCTVRLSDLASELRIVDLTPVLWMIRTGVLHAKLGEQLLSRPDSCWVARSEFELGFAETISDAASTLGFTHHRPPSVGTLAVPSATKAERIVGQLTRIDGGSPNSSTRRWRRKIEEGKSNGLSEAQALCPKWSGNTEPKRDPRVLDFLATFVKETFGDPAKRLTAAAAHREYKVRAETHHSGLAPVSLPTFASCIRRHALELAFSRGGRRAANAAAPPSPVEEREIRATLPFEVATIDHYLVDIRCPLLEARETFSASPWLTVIRDIATKAVLAQWLSFKAPSRRACAIVLRQCLRQHGRLPDAIVVDRGSEFRSVFFAAFLAHCGIDLHYRPATHPRYGSEAERVFGLFKTMWLVHRGGNTANRAAHRAASASLSPDQFAEIPLDLLYSELIEFSEWLNANPSPSQLEAPSIAMTRGLAMFERSGAKIPYDETFVVASAVDVRDFKVDPRRGLHVGARHYWNPQLSVCRGRVERLEVREDPEDASRLYARIGDRWLTCTCSDAPEFDLLDPLVRIVRSIKILDQLEARKAAKDAADRDLIRKLDEANAQLRKTRQGPSKLPKGDPDECPPISTWSPTPGTDVSPLETTPWAR